MLDPRREGAVPLNDQPETVASHQVSVVGAAVLIALGAGFGGPIGGLAAVAGLALARRCGYRAVAAGAIVALGVAAVLTVVEARATGASSDYLFYFALDRPLAADAGVVAGILGFVAIVLAAREERDTPDG